MRIVIVCCIFLLVFISIVQSHEKESSSDEDNADVTASRFSRFVWFLSTIRDFYRRIMSSVGSTIRKTFRTASQLYEESSSESRESEESEESTKLPRDCEAVYYGDPSLIKLANGKIYQFNYEKMDFLDALVRCKVQGMKMLKIKDYDEFKLLSDYIGQTIQHHAGSLDIYYLIGLNNQIDQDGKFLWVDFDGFEEIDEKLNERAWLSGQPSYLPDEHCVGLTYISYDEIGWNDVSCKFQADFICEAKKKCNAWSDKVKVFNSSSILL